MTTTLHRPSFLAIALLALGVGAAFDALGQDAAAAGAEACEREVAETVKRVRGRDAQQVQFTGGKRVLQALSDDETGINGEGRFRNAAGQSTPFTYSCTYNAKTGATSGVLFRDAGLPERPAGAVPARPEGAPIASTDACETAVTKLLQVKHPRVARVAFGSDTRSLRPAANARTAIEGEGAVERAPGMSAVRFRYRCLFDARSGRVDDVQISEPPQ